MSEFKIINAFLKRMTETQKKIYMLYQVSTVKEMCSILKMQESTVRSHLSSINKIACDFYEKNDISLADLMNFLAEEGK